VITAAWDDTADGEPRWERDPHALWKVTPFATVVLPPVGDETLVLAGTSAELWDLLGAPRTVGQLTGILAERYDEAPSRIRADLSGALDALANRCAVRSSP